MTVRNIHKILSLATLLSMVFASVCLSAKTKVKQAKKKQSITIGFQTGRSTKYNASSMHSSSKSKTYLNDHKIVFNKTINRHFKAETGIGYSLYQNGNQGTGLNNSNTQSFHKSNQPYFPLSVQYYPLSEKTKFHPFCGVGLQFNPNLNASFTSPFNSTGDSYPSQGNTMPGTKYISIIFTQGVTYEINTKIQITQSFHFLQNNNDNTLGIDVGVSFSLP